MAHQPSNVRLTTELPIPRPAPLPDDALLGAYAARGAYTDCFALEVPGQVGLATLVEAFCTTPLFKLERRVLATLLKRPSTDLEARQLAQGTRERFAAWRVEHRCERQILLDAGQTRLWLAVAPPADAQTPRVANTDTGVAAKTTTTTTTTTTLMLGSAVVPMRPNGRFGIVFHALKGLHVLYSTRLLAAAGRRVAALAGEPPGH